MYLVVSLSIIYTNVSYYILYIEYVHVAGYLQVEWETYVMQRNIAFLQRGDHEVS